MSYINKAFILVSLGIYYAHPKAVLLPAKLVPERNKGEDELYPTVSGNDCSKVVVNVDGSFSG